MSRRQKPTYELTPERRALLEALLQKDGRQPVRLEPIARRNAAEPAKLSFAQERLWFLEQLVPGHAVYLIPAAVRIRGLLNVNALAAGLTEILRRHEVLRTTLVRSEDGPRQAVQPIQPLRLPIVDLSTVPAATQEAQLHVLARAEAQRPFDLAEAPLLRAQLVRLGTHEHVLLLTLHHIAADGWSVGMLVQELAVLYPALAAGHAASLPELPIQYADFASWQRHAADEKALHAQLAYWRRQLAGAPQVLELPADHPRPPIETFRGARQAFTLSPTLTSSLQQLSQSEGASLFMTLLAAFKVLLWRYTGATDLVVGTPIANRTRPELEGLIGCFVNTLVLRTNCAGNPSFRTLLARVRETCLGAYAHQDLPFERLVETLQPMRDLSRQPLFQVMLIFQNLPQLTLEVDGLQLEPVELETDTAKFDLTLTCMETPEGMRAWLEYNTDLFEPATIARIAADFQRVLEAVAADPGQHLEALPVPPRRQVNQPVPPALELRPPALEAVYVAPRTSTEALLAGVWADILGITRVGIHDNFFALGGHSLLATRLTERLRKTLNADVPLRWLFEHPTVAELAAVLATRQPSDEAAGLPMIVPEPAQRYEPFPLTDVQHAYWIGRTGLYAMGNVATHVYLELESPTVDPLRLQTAIGRLIERHDMLRMIVREDGQQVVLAQVPPFELPVEDLSRLEPRAAEEALAQTRTRLSHQVLPTNRWPLFQVAISRLADRCRIHVSLDMLVFDAWSMRLLGRELLRLYAEPEQPLEPLTLTFRDYVLAERRLEDTAPYRRSLTYWQQRLATLPPPPELPLARNPETITAPRFAMRTATLDAPMWQQLAHRAASAGMTPTVAVLAAYAAVLSAFSKHPALTVNLTLFRRLPLHPDAESLIGDFTSLTMLEVRPGPREAFVEQARRLLRQLWEDLDHRYVSGIKILRELSRQRGTQMTMPVVFTSTLGLGAPGGSGDASAMHRVFGDLVYANTQTPQVWIDNQVGELAGALISTWSVVEELFPPGLIDAMFTAYEGLLRRLATDDAAWQEVPQLVPAAQLAERALANATEGPQPDELLFMPFRRQAATRPEAPAVLSERRRLSYGELAGRATALAKKLRAAGVQPNTLVAVVMDKGWEQVAAVLGVLEAGAAYLPVEPTLPTQRRHHLLDQGQVRWALTQSWLDASLEWLEGIQRICVDQEGVDAGPPLAPVQEPDDLAYVIFTSGSTGLPKGVMIDHRGALNTVLDVNERFGVGPGDRVLALSALGFDLSVYDVFGLLAAGGAIVMPDAQERGEPSQWLALCTRHGVTLWNTVPALLEMLVEHLASQERSLPPSLRLAMLSGDWIPLTLPKRVWSRAPQAKLVSLGGATETSIWSILYPVDRVDPSWRSVPYGRPMRNQTFHVLDEALEPKPVWVPGQLYIGGLGLAKGYWRDEDQTRAAFITHPRTSERLYRTGDMGRYLPGGEIEFLGREDGQIKLQGHRIELGEIEAVLGQHPAVHAAVVGTDGPRRDARRLIAYVVWRGADPDPEALRAYAAARLPAYMVPQVFVRLDALPLSLNGKVDRNALPAPEDDGQAYVGPRTPVEEQLAALWGELLGVERIGIHDNFFRVGGDSLRAMQFISRVRDVFQVELPLRRLFERPTVAGAAEEIEHAARQGAPQRAPSIVPVSRVAHRATVSPEGELVLPERLKDNLQAGP